MILEGWGEGNELTDSNREGINTGIMINQNKNIIWF